MILLGKESIELLLQCLKNHKPDLIYVVESKDEILIDEELGNELRDAVTDELIMRGFDEDDNSNKYGLSLESLIDEIGRLFMKPEFNQVRAMEILKKHVLVGITICDNEENILEERQFHGDIIRVDKREGIVIKINNSSEEYTLPPDPEAFKEAPPGEYRPRSTGEVVTNPDLLTTWTVKKP